MSGEFSMLDLFRSEVETQAAQLSEHLLALETRPNDAVALEALMRAAHSIKGAGRMVSVESAVRIAHVLEDLFVAAQQGRLTLTPAHIDVLLTGVDMLKRIAQGADQPDWAQTHAQELDALLQTMSAAHAGTPDVAATPSATAPASIPASIQTPAAATAPKTVRDSTMLDLFRIEVDSQTRLLADGLLELEQNPSDAARLEAMMRAAHSIKGAARMVDIAAGVRIAHVMEDGLVAAQHGKLVIGAAHVDLLLRGVDMLGRIGNAADIDAWAAQHATDIDTLEAALATLPTNTPPPVIQAAAAQPETAPPTLATLVTPTANTAAANTAKQNLDSAIRVSAESLNRLMGLAGEVQVEARWLRPYADALVQFKHRHTELISLLDKLRDAVELTHLDEYARSLLGEAQHKAAHCRKLLGERLNELDEYDRRSHNLASRLNREVIASRMRPFADGVHGFQRMVRDLARTLGKHVHLDIRGFATQVDRDILEKIEAPLNHLLRNAVDHGIEMPADRLAAGKPEQATIRLEAMHSAGMLSIVVEDDGRGMELDRLRHKIVQRKLVSQEMAADLSEAELMDFLFLPGFSTREQVTEISGRGVGLDVVHSVVQEMHGIVHATAQPGKGMRFHLQLPLTLSVMRALMVEIAGEPYVFPLAQIHRTLKLPRHAIEVMEGRQYFTLINQHIGLIAGNQVLGLEGEPPEAEEVCIVVLGERLDRYGLVVDRFMGERNLVVQSLDPRLGKVKDINAAAILENGDPCLIIDVDDLLRSINILIAGGRLDKIRRDGDIPKKKVTKRILVVDDSITVREVERNMLVNRGYDVEVAVDGMDGWNAVRTGEYDLVISDVDMPRMNGFEFVGLIKKDPQLKSLPVMIVSYKDRDEDRRRGLEVGADYYLTKGSFHDETLLDAVADLIGQA
ncbi:MAG: hybrid sensor histidine kinase/response regulator [Gammaproteobacteria bacterium]|nr:hybrid sensor histidine kinase/response regulator [Gammaproteobacteria bacterium]